ncbi:hypothetical protein BH11PSE11_BH11PSE11_12750 [soil metagenome]
MIDMRREPNQRKLRMMMRRSKRRQKSRCAPRLPFGRVCLRRNRQARQEGVTIVELMIAMALGLLVVLLATVLLLSSKAGFTTQDEAARIQDSGRYAIETISRAVRQAAYENWDSDEGPILTALDAGANIAGLDANSLKESSNGLDSPVQASINGSDVLALRFFGAGTGSNGDGTMLNCAGFGVASPASKEGVDEERGWSIFYVAADTNGEPELRCKYRGKTAWSSDAIARGVESFQVLYGVDTDLDGMPNQFLTASAIQSLDDALVLTGEDDAARERDRNRKTWWKKVVVVKFGLLLRGSQNSRSDTLNKQYDLFGKDYAEAHAASDRGTRLNEAKLPVATRNRIRKMFTITVQLRNHAAGGAA